MNGLIGKQLEEQKPDFQTQAERTAKTQAVIIFTMFCSVACALAWLIQTVLRGGF